MERPPLKLPKRANLAGYRAPRSTVGRFFWRCKLWVDSTFVTGLLEPWEMCIVFSFFLMFMFLLVWSMYQYLPSQIVSLVSHAHYYLLGADSTGAALRNI